MGEHKTPGLKKTGGPQSRQSRLRLGLRPWSPLVPAAVLVLLWQGISMAGLLPGYMLPSPLRVAGAFTGDFPLLMFHLGRTLLEAAAGLALAVAAAFFLSILMDLSPFLKTAVNPRSSSPKPCPPSPWPPC
jgi:ABC-type nitrate/sulfonate/bicarbonate transport system permease component